MSFHTDEALLRYEHVDVSFKGCAVLHDISISLGRGEILAVVGESGCGKSTLLRAAVKLLGASGLITRGHIWFEGKDLPALSERALRPIRGASVGMIFQDASASLAPVRTVGEQVFEAVAAHERTTEREVRKRAFDLFRTLHFETPERLWESYPFELSGGMCQRVGIVMAMLLRPQVLLADEPTSALDASVEVEVMRELLALREQFGTAIMLVTHDMGVAARMADRLLVLKDGRMVEIGSAADVLRHGLVRAADEDIRLDADGQQLLDGVLCGLALKLARAGNFDDHGHMDEQDVFLPLLGSHLPDGLEERL